MAALVNECIQPPFSLGNSNLNERIGWKWGDFNFMEAFEILPKMDNEMAFLQTISFL